MKHSRVMVPLASSVVASATNFGVVLAVSASGGATDLGAFAIVTAPGLMSVGLMRSISTQMFLADRRPMADSLRLISGLALGSTILSGLVCLASSSAAEMAWVVVGLPALIIQDMCRFYFFGQQRPEISLISDLTWLFTMGLLVVVAASSASLSAPFVGFAWSVGAWAAIFVLTGPITSALRRPDHGPAIQRALGNARLPLTLEAVGAVLCGQALLYGLATMTSLSELGLFRFTQTLLSPVSIVAAGVLAYVVPRLDHEKPDTRPLSATKTSGLAAFFVGAVVVVFVSSAPRVMSRTGIDRSTSLVILLSVGVIASTLSATNQVNMVKARRQLAGHIWVKKRLSAAVVEPVLGLGLATGLGALGAMIGVLGHQAVLSKVLRSNRRQSINRDHEFSAADPPC